MRKVGVYAAGEISTFFLRRMLGSIEIHLFSEQAITESISINERGKENV